MIDFDPKALEKNREVWKNVWLNIKRTEPQPPHESWTYILHNECRERWHMDLRQFDVFSASEYDSLSEARAALKEMYTLGIHISHVEMCRLIKDYGKV